MKITCFVGIGSNLGDRKKNIKLALKKINSLPQTKIIKVAKIIETKPQGGPKNQHKFLNTVAKIKTNLGPFRLLKEFKRIEKELGRKKTVRFGPRTIDLDILIYADKVINHRRLKVPHPRIFEREFVLRPLIEVLFSKNVGG